MINKSVIQNSGHLNNNWAAKYKRMGNMIDRFLMNVRYTLTNRDLKPNERYKNCSFSNSDPKKVDSGFIQFTEEQRKYSG